MRRVALALLLLGAAGCGASTTRPSCGDLKAGSELIDDRTDPKLTAMVRRCAGGVLSHCTPMCLELIERAEGAPLGDDRVLVECAVDRTTAEASHGETVARWSHEAKCAE